MAITVTLVGTDLKISEGGVISYRPFSDVTQRAIGTTIELYENGKKFRADLASDYANPSGTAEQICDAISELSAGGSLGDVEANVKSKINRIKGAANYAAALTYNSTEPTNVETITHTGTTDLGSETITETLTYVNPQLVDSNITNITYS